MRFTQFKPLTEQRLDEINMSPASLRQLASKIEGAKAGLEFELVIRDMASDDESGESAPDYDSDESCDDIDEIVRFFDDGNVNSNGDIRRLREKLEEDYFEWQNDQMSDAFDSVDLPELLTTYFKDQEGLEGDELEQAVANEIDSPDRAYDMVREEWEDEARDQFDERTWLRAEGNRYMSDIENSYVITWPHWTNASSAGSRDPADVAASFEQAVGRKVHLSTGYHDYSVKRQNVGDDFYIAEPDSSIEGDEVEDSGLEFVSPPLSISDMLLDLKDVAKWCKQGNAYTNESTGLHMNISVPNYSYDNLDFIKLALLMGDDHVSESFGRLGAHYAKSAMAIVKRNIANRPESAKGLLDQMKSHLNAAASKAVHSGNTDKYTSINVKDGRVEFRSPGGNWLDDFEDGKVENTLLRFVVALDAAVDETKYKEEYAKKLYKLLAPAADSGDNDTIKYFSQYAARMMPQSALKSFVRQAQVSRGIKKDIAKGAGGKYWWNVSTAGGHNSIEIVASNEAEAKKVAAKNWGLDVNNPMVYSSYVAKPLRPFKPGDVGDEQVTAAQDDGEQKYEIYNTDTGAQLTTFFASGMGDALDRTENYLRTQELGNASHNVRLASEGDADRASRQTAVQGYRWRVRNPRGNEAIVVAPNESQAISVGARFHNLLQGGDRYYAFGDLSAENLGPVEEQASQAAAPQADNWEVYDVNTGEVKFRFHAADGVAAVERQHMSAYADDRQFRVRQIGQQGAQAGTEYEIYNRYGENQIYTYRAATPQEAQTMASDYVESHLLNRREVNFRTVDQGNDARRIRQNTTQEQRPERSWRIALDNGTSYIVAAQDHAGAARVASQEYGDEIERSGGIRTINLIDQ